jgi:nucleoside-diphosphate-sugar epimerase
MRIFLTGATGYIGSAVAVALRRRAYDVAALVRADSDTGILRDHGVVLVTGGLDSLPSLSGSLSSYNAYVHTAMAKQDTAALDRTAVDVFAAADGYFLFTSGVWVLGNTTGGKGADESSRVNPLPIVAWRPEHEEIALRSRRNGVLRPGIVYGGRQGILADRFASADQNRPVQIVGDGSNRWPMVDVAELAELYVRAVEQRTAGILHGVDDTDATVEECAREVARNGKVVKIPLELAREKLGPYADALASNQAVSSEETRQRVGSGGRFRKPFDGCRTASQAVPPLRKSTSSRSTTSGASACTKCRASGTRRTRTFGTYSSKRSVVCRMNTGSRSPQISSVGISIGRTRLRSSFRCFLSAR